MNIPEHVYIAFQPAMREYFSMIILPLCHIAFAETLHDIVGRCFYWEMIDMMMPFWLLLSHHIFSVFHFHDIIDDDDAVDDDIYASFYFRHYAISLWRHVTLFMYAFHCFFFFTIFYRHEIFHCIFFTWYFYHWIMRKCLYYIDISSEMSFLRHIY